MDQQTKSAIKSLVLDLRHSLEAELEIVLKRYGIFTDRLWSLQEPPERLSDPIERQAWERIVVIVRKHIKEGRTIQQASLDYIRESAFTYLNRLVGLKCLEVRGIIDEVITTRKIYGGRSKQHRDYREEHPHETRSPDDALPACIAEACRQVNNELIGYLFDPDDDHSLVWPRYPVLKGCIEKINALDETVWKEDEIIGWIYQFYNAEEKVAIRKRGKPQTPHDVAVINQFFTPRWVVKFLVDNTLGRLWLEMHPDSPRVRQKCDYLVPEPLSVEEEVDTGERKFQLDPDSPVNNPQAAPRREPKPVTELKLLDPACGTMHFGHYAMEVFEAIYRDAREWGEITIDDERIPSAILENNLFGVDIDRRAVQLAALSLFMKARTMHPRAKVRQVNLVVADATLPNGAVRQKFLERYKGDKAVQRAFAQVLEDMDQVAQVGSLLRVEERLKELLAKAGHASVAKSLDFDRQQDLPGFAPPARQMGLAEVVPDEQKASLTPHLTLQEMRDDLRAFARQALEEHDVTGQLFATEADKAMRLLDVLMGEYDVVVMNPPYGYSTKAAKDLLENQFVYSKNDLFAMFIDRGQEFLSETGYVGALTSRTFLNLLSLEDFRKNVILKLHLVCLLDFGFGILDDATVKTAAWVICKAHKTSDSVFVRLDKSQNNYQTAFAKSLVSICETQDNPLIYIVDINSFSSFPGNSIAYWAPRAVKQIFRNLKRLKPDFGDAIVGLQTSDDARYLRYFWEVLSHEIGANKKWIPFSKGGDFSRYYYNYDLIILWEEDGQELKSFSRAYIRNEKYYLREGLSYPLTTVKGFNLRYLPKGHIWGHVGPVIIPKNIEDLWFMLGLLNSKLVEAFLSMTISRNFEVGFIRELPIPQPSIGSHRQLSDLSRKIYDLKLLWDTGNEISTSFKQPLLLQIPLAQKGKYSILGVDIDKLEHFGIELSELLVVLGNIEIRLNNWLQDLQNKIDMIVYDLYQINKSDQSIIDDELNNRSPEIIWPEMEGKSGKEKQREHVRRFFSYFVLHAIDVNEDGVIPLSGTSGQQPYLIDKVRTQMEELFGAQTAYQFEQDAVGYLGRSLEEWLVRDFFAKFHVKLYKNRPILWHLTSPKGYFAVMIDYHRLDRDTLPKVQALYLWPQMEAVRSRLNAARQNGAPAKTLAELEEELADLKDCDERLSAVIQGTVKVELPEWAHGPYRDGKPPYDPDLDDGVRVNLLPIQEAGLLPVKKVV